MLVAVSTAARWLGGCWSGFTALLYSTSNIFYSDPVNAVKAAPEECWGKRKIASRTLPLDDFKATAKQLGVTINTLAVSCVGGGVRRYLQAQQQAVPKSVRMLVTVDTRALKSAPAGSGKDSMSRVPANCFTYIAVPVCTGDISPVERLGRVDRAIDWIRHSPALMLAVVMPAVTKVRCCARCHERHANACSTMPLRMYRLFRSVRCLGVADWISSNLAIYLLCRSNGAPLHIRQSVAMPCMCYLGILLAFVSLCCQVLPSML